MHTILVRTAGALALLVLATAVPADAQQATTARSLNLPVTGSFQGGGSFTGTVSINRFEQRNGNQIVAVGFVTGVLTRGSKAIGTAVTGEVSWPVAVRSGAQPLTVRGTPMSRGLQQIAWSPRAQQGRYLFAQDATCPVLHTELVPITVNLLGLQVALEPVTLDLSGMQGTPLGDLICAASDLLGNVAALVELLNNILGLLIGLLGGLTGGLGGIVA